MSVSILETVRAALEKDDQQYLRVIEADLKKRIDDAPKRTIEDLLSACEQHKLLSWKEFCSGIIHPEACSTENKKALYGLKVNTKYILF